MVWLNTARGDGFEVGERCLPVPLTEPGNHSIWTERERRKRECVSRANQHHEARFFKPPHQARALTQLSLGVSLPASLIRSLPNTLAREKKKGWRGRAMSGQGWAEMNVGQEEKKGK